MTTLPNYLLDKIYYGSTWDLVSYPDEIIESIRNIIKKGKSLSPDPLTMLSLELGYISELQVQTGDFTLSTSKMMSWMYGDDRARYVMRNRKGDTTNPFNYETTISVALIGKEIWTMLSENTRFFTNDMLDWRKVLDQMLWHNYQILINMKLVTRIRNDFPETIKESLRDQESWRGNWMQLFNNCYLYNEEGTKGNEWLNKSIEEPLRYPLGEIEKFSEYETNFQYFEDDKDHE